MRLRKKPWITEAIKEYDKILVSGGTGLDWEKIFGRRAPLHLELGTGKGRFVSELAAGNSQLNCVGIEAQRDIIYYAAQKIAQRNLSNARLMLFDVNNIMDVFRPGEVERIYINFCDPWPKNRHSKRRLTHRGFLEKYRLLLGKGGELHFKTDNERLFEFSLNEFAATGLMLRNICLDLHNRDFVGNIMTEYEEKFSTLGMRIYRCEVVF